MSMRPSWLPLDRLTYGLPLPAFMFAPVEYGLPVTLLPNLKPLVFVAIDVKLGQPLDSMVAL